MHASGFYCRLYSQKDGLKDFRQIFDKTKPPEIFLVHIDTEQHMNDYSTIDFGFHPMAMLGCTEAKMALWYQMRTCTMALQD